MNILFHCWECPPRGSGLGQHIRHMAAALREAGRFTVVVTSAGGNLSARVEMQRGVVCRACDMGELGTARMMDFVLGFARRHSADLIEAVDHLGESAFLPAIKDRPPVPVKTHSKNMLSALLTDADLRAGAGRVARGRELRAYGPAVVARRYEDFVLSRP